MLEDFKKEIISLKLLSVLLTIAVAIYLLQFVWQFLGNFSDIIIVLILSWLLSFILEPIVERLSNLIKISRTISALLVYLLFTGIIALLVFMFIPAVSYQLDTLSKTVPDYLETAPKYVQKWNKDLISSLDNAASLIPSVANFLFLFLIVVIISFYLIVDRHKIEREMYDLIPQKLHKSFKMIENIVNHTFASFIRVQLVFAIINGLLTWAVLRLFNVGFAASTSVISGILTTIPMVGPIFAIVPPVFISFTEDPFKAVIVFVIGWFVAIALGKVVEKMVRTIKIDHALQKIGWEKRLSEVGISANMAEFFGGLVKWFLILVFLMAATDILQLNQVTEFINSILLYIPNVVVAVVILSVVFIVGNFVYNVVKGSTKAAGVMSATMLAAISKWAIIIFGVLAALLQLGIASSLVSTIFIGIVAMFSLAGGLAFGLGGRDEAAVILRKLREEITR